MDQRVNKPTFSEVQRWDQLDLLAISHKAGRNMATTEWMCDDLGCFVLLENVYCVYIYIYGIWLYVLNMHAPCVPTPWYGPPTQPVTGTGVSTLVVLVEQ